MGRKESKENDPEAGRVVSLETEETKKDRELEIVVGQEKAKLFL